MDSIQNIVFIGAGNVATQLALTFKNAGVEILQIFSRSESSACELAERVEAKHTTDLKKLNSEADLYIISITDNAIEDLVVQLSLNDNLVVHTSGSVSIEILQGISNNFGVFYPLQTFSKSRAVEFENIPLCIEANNSENLKCLKTLANLISNRVYDVNSGQRKVLHLAAVFACNFPNYMYSIAEEITKQADIDFDMLRPLIKETAEKVMQINPMEAQTGPAKRGDEKIMSEHLKMLSDFPEFKEIYKLISVAIQTQNTEH